MVAIIYEYNMHTEIMTIILINNFFSMIGKNTTVAITDRESKDDIAEHDIAKISTQSIIIRNVIKNSL